MLERAYENWRDLEKRTSTQIYYLTGVIYFGNHQGIVIKGIKKFARDYDIPFKTLSKQTVQTSYSRFIPLAHHEAVYEPDAGFLLSKKAISLFVTELIAGGAIIKARKRVIECKKNGDDVFIKTDKGSYSARHLIICPCAWTSKIVNNLKSSQIVTIQLLAWMDPKK